MNLFLNLVVKIGLTSAEYFTIEDSTVMKVILTLEDNQPANTSFTVSLKLTPRSASGYICTLHIFVYHQ